MNTFYKKILIYSVISFIVLILVQIAPYFALAQYPVYVLAALLTFDIVQDAFWTIKNAVRKWKADRE